MLECSYIVTYNNKLIMASAEVNSTWNGIWKNSPPFAPVDAEHDTISVLTRRVINNLNDGKNIFLDIGAGPGSRTIPIVGSRPDINLILFDQSKKALELGQKFASDLQVNSAFVQGDGFQLPFPDNSVSCVFANGLNEHFLDPLRQNLIEEMVRTTKPEGIVAIIVPNKLNPFNTVNKIVSERRGTWEYGPQYDFTPNELLERMEKAGLKDLKTYGVGAYTSIVRMLPRERQKRFYKSPTPFGWLNKRLWDIDCNDTSPINRRLGREILVIGKKLT